MTVKKILALVLLTGLGLSAQTPPGPAAPPADDAVLAARLAEAATNAPAGARQIAPPGATIRRRPRGEGAAPAAPGAAPAPGQPVPGPAPVQPAPVPAPQPQPAPAGAPPAAAAPAPAIAPAPAAEEEFIKAGQFDFTGAEVWTLLNNYYANWVARTILRAPTAEQALKAPVFFRNQTPLTRSEAIQAFEAIFAMNNLGLVPAGDKFLKAVPLAEAVKAGAKPSVVTNASELRELGQYVTYITQLKFVKPSEMLQVLAPFQSMNASVAIDSSQILLLRDLTENVKRMLEMIERVDVAYSSEFESEVIPIKFAKAEEIASALSALSGSGSTMTVGSRPAGGGGPSPVGSRPGLGGYPGSSGLQGSQINPLGSNPAGTPSSSASFSDRINQIINRAAKSSTSGSGDFQIIGPNKIVADVRSNSLMVFASKQDMLTIKKIIAQLDVVLAQVLIETIILDVTLTDGHNIGLSYLQKTPTRAGNFTGIGAINNTGFLTDSAFTALTNGGGSLGSGFSYLGHLGPDLDVTLTAIANDSSVKVVQKPRIMTSHATSASVFIGSTVPYVTGTYYGGYGGNAGNSYQQLRVGIQLTVTPYVNQDGLVVMKIDEAIDEISGSVAISGVGDVPTTTSRTLAAEVAVGDRETIVLGGFIRSSGSDSKSGVPVLKDIPLLGPLFSSNSRNKSRNELMVLMRPTVLRTPELASAHTAIEKSRLPGIRRAEAESEADETRRVQDADRKLGPSVPPAGGAAGTPVTPARDKDGFLPFQ